LSVETEVPSGASRWHKGWTRIETDIEAGCGPAGWTPHLPTC